VQPNPPHNVTVSEVDSLLDAVASAITFSSPAVRAANTTLLNPHRLSLESLYTRLSPLEAKWFTRLVLKDYNPANLDETVVLGCYHPILPCVMKVFDHFSPALAFLKTPRPGGRPDEGRCNGRDMLRDLKPALGTKVGRPLWRKARSIKHCLDMGHGRVSVEKKMDGEYCQVHVDLSKGRNCIQIFSKSGKDSTKDRHGLHR
jgi:DNA ligase-4